MLPVGKHGLDPSRRPGSIEEQGGAWPRASAPPGGDCAVQLNCTAQSPPVGAEARGQARTCSSMLPERRE